MQSVHDLRNRVHKRMLIGRKLVRLVESMAFVIAYEAAAPEERARIDRLFDEENEPAIDRWVGEQREKDHASYSLRKLRDLGRDLGIPYSSRMDKPTLLSEIAQHERRSRKRNEEHSTAS